MPGQYLISMAHIELFRFILIGLTLPHTVLCNNPPLFVNLNPTFLVPENMPLNSTLTRLDAQDSDDTTLTFSVIGYPAADILRVLRIGDKSALVLLALPLDREILDQFSVTFQVTDGVNPPIQRTCLVIVTDVNDNPPKLRNLPAKVDLSENTSNGTVLYTVFATDPDTGVGGIVTYELLNEQAMFQMEPTSGNVTVIGKLVYVVRRTYLLHIRATDGGGLNSTGDLTINVLDSQSRPPYFLHSPYEASVGENTSLGTAVIQVTAYDGVTGLPGQVLYSIVSGDPGFFAINASTGWITVNKVIDCSNPEVLRRNGLLEVVVKASSISASSNADVSSWALVSLQLIDVNNHGPTFNQVMYNTTLLENSMPNTLLSFNTGIVISDLDMGDNAKYRIFLLQNGLPFDAFGVIPSNGEGETNVLIQVKNVALLNLAHTTMISFSVVAQEYLTAERFSSSATVIVSIVSQDDMAPLFQQDEYFAMIRENPQLGTFVLRATAMDQDPSGNHQIAYSLRGSKASLFAVNTTTGDVFVNVDAASNHSLLDRETASAVSFMIEAINGGGLRSFALLTVNLDDANDSLPVMTSQIYYAVLQENANSFLFPVIIQATTRDLKSQIVYSIVSGDHLGNFAIGRDTGLVSMVTALDYETLAPGTNGVVNLIVMATNRDVPTLNATAILRVIVQDVNDNAPRFQQPVYQVAILETTVGGSSVVNVTATDVDGTSPDNSIRYSIISGSQNKFVIDADRGWITVAPSASLDYDTFGSQYILTVQATDGGAPALSSTAIVNVTILDINNKPPVFVGGKQFVATVKEDAAIGTVVMQLIARDPDENNRLMYRFVDFSMSGFDGSGNVINNDSYLTDLIGVDPGTGTVTLKRKLDGETLQMLTVTVMVEDLNSQTGVKQNDTATLTLVVRRVDNEAPRFLPPTNTPLTVHIAENSPPGTTVARLVAVDPYSTSNTIAYSIEYDSDASTKFEITDANREIGTVTLKYSIYPATFESVTLKVTAARLGRPQLNSSALLIVVIDVDSSGLRWDVFPSVVSLLENVTVGINVSTVSAVATIGQPHGPITYSIVSDVLGKFRIDNRTGLLVTSGQLTSRQMSAYHLTIAAEVVISTPSIQVKRIFGDMTINVISTNNPPRFDQQFYTGYALTNATAGTFVMTARATDFDQNSILTYYVDRRSGNGSWLFDVDPISGGISVGSSLAASAGNWFFTVLANDRGFPALVGSAVVNVKVIDSSGNRLRIVSPPANVSLYVVQNQPAGQFVVVVKSEYIGTGGSSQIYYDFVTSPSSQDWQSFAIDHQTGVITTARTLNAGRSNYYLQVQAKDISNEMFSDQCNLTLTVRTSIGDYPRFSRVRYPPPLRATVVEGMSNVVVVNVNIADQSSLSGSACYYIVGGSEEWMNKFSLDKLSGDLWLVVSLTEVQTTYVDLVIKVSDDCWSGFWELDQNRHSIWNVSDDTLILVRVDVVGFGVGQPRLTKRSFIAGVLPDVQLEEPVLSLADYTQSGNKTLVIYSLGTEFRMSDSLKAGINSLQRPPFVIGHVDGVIQTNTYFQDNWIGSINFDATVGIVSHYPSDTANVTVYLLSKYQMVRVTLSDTPNEVGAIREQFTEFLSNATRTIVGIYSIQAHKTESGGSDSTQTDMIIYAVDPSYQTVLDAMTLKNLIDKKYIDERDTFSHYNVTAVVPVEDVVAAQTSLRGTERSVVIAFAVVGTFLVLFLCILCLMGCLCHKKFKRKIKAANAIAAVSDSSNSNLHQHDAPGTNAYNTEGSNPVWQGTFAPNEFYNLSDSDSRNSFDETNTKQTSSGSQEEFLDISDTTKPNSHSKKMHFYKVNGFDESRSDSYASNGTLNQNHVRRLVPAKKPSPEKDEPKTNGLATSTTNFMTPSTVV